MTQLVPKKKSTYVSRWANGIRVSNRGIFEVISNGYLRGKITLSIVKAQKDWFLRTKGLDSSDYCILRASKMIRYDRMTKTFTIDNPLVIGQLSKMGVKPVVIDDTPDTSITSRNGV